MMQQTAVSPQLQALMTLAQGTQQGAVSPVTPDGRPTVAGQLLQQAAPQPAAPQGMPPGMPQMRQNAGIAGQIQAMQMQEAQKALMGQAQAQQRAQQQAPVLGGGIAMAPGAQGMRMAEGGIVGYADGGGVAPDYSAAEAERERGIGAITGIKTEPPAPADVGQRATSMAEAENAFLRSQGVDPALIAKEIENRRRLSEQEVALYRQREQDTREGAARRRLMAFLGGAEGRSPWRGSNQARDVEAARQDVSIQKAQDAALAAQKAAAVEQYALRQAQDATARGKWKEAQEWLAKAQEAKNAVALEEGKARMQAAGQMGQEATSAAQIAAQIRGQDVSKEVARIGAAARGEGGDLKERQFRLRQLQADPQYDGIKKRLTQTLPYAGKPGITGSMHADAVQAANRLYRQYGLTYEDVAAMEGTPAGPSAPSMLDKLPPGVTVKRIQ